MPCKPTTTKTKCQCLDHTYARELEVDVRHVRMAGGAAKLRAMAPEARALLLAPAKPRAATRQQPQEKYRGGLKARGFLSGVPGITRPHPGVTPDA